MPYIHDTELVCDCRAFELILVRRSELKWKAEAEAEAEKRAARAAKLDAARAAKRTTEAEQR